MNNYKYAIVIIILIICACGYKITSNVGEELNFNKVFGLIFLKGNEYGILKPEFEYLIIEGSEIVGSDKIEVKSQKITVALDNNISFKIKDQKLSGKGYRIYVNAVVIPKKTNGNLHLSVYLPNIKKIENALDKNVFFPAKVYNATDKLVRLETVDVNKNKMNMYFALAWKRLKWLFILIIIIIAIILFFALGGEIEI